MRWDIVWPWLCPQTGRRGKRRTEERDRRKVLRETANTHPIIDSGVENRK